MRALYDTAQRRLGVQGEESRCIILSAIQSHSGLRYRELARRTGLANGALSHHIKILERQKRIVVKRYKGFTWLFPEDYEGGLCNAISAASHPTTVEIMKLLLRHECNFQEVKDTVMKSRSTICEHLKRLCSVDRVSRINRVWIYGIADADKAVLIMNRR